MIRNYLIVAYRNLARQLTFSLINIIGLALGIACSMIILLFVYKELSYDRHFSNADRIYRISTSFINLGTFANGPQQLNERLRQYPGIEATTRIEFNGEVQVESESIQQIEDIVYEVDSSFFRLFDYIFLSGNPVTCLQDPESIVISEAVALKYFKTKDALGKTLLVGKEKTLRSVTGIVKDEQLPSHLTARIWMPLVLNKPDDGNWNSAYVYNYIMLKEGFASKDLEKNIELLIKNEVYPTYGGDLTYEEWIKTANSNKFYAQPLTDIYLSSKLRSEISTGGSQENVYIFSGVASLILFLALVNFVNLSTARAAGRAKEVGLRKTLGTSRRSLIFQFLLESVLTSLLALGISLVLGELFLGGYRLVIGQELLPGIFTNISALLLVILTTCLLGVVAGLYPAFYLTSFQPVKVLKGQIRSTEKSGLRNALVTFQFTISIVLIAFVLIILKQLNFLNHKDLGFDKENVFVINNIAALGSNKEPYKNKLNELSQVMNSCFTSNPPAGSSFWAATYHTDKMEGSITYNTIPGDEKLLETLGIQLLEGRNFDPSIDSGRTAVILNEAAVNDLMLENPIGEYVNKGQKVIGVVRDFHFKTVQNTIEPVVIMYKRDGSDLAFKLSGGIKEFINAAEVEWKRFLPNEPIKYSFIDQNFFRLLEKERRFSRIIILFCVLAICISGLGLFGLSLYATEQRTKELGIRKVMGASMGSILFLLTKSFTRLVLLAFVLAVPISIYAINKWLANFAYRIDVGWSVFAITLFSIVVISWATVAWSSWKVATKNPVDILKYE